MPSINLNSLISNDSIYQIKIIPPEDSGVIPSKFKIISGFLTNNLSFSGQNTWEGLHSGFQWMKDQSDNVSKVQPVLAQAGVSDGKTYTIGGITETIARWQSAMKPTFAFNVMFIRLNPSDDIITPVKILLKGCLPMDSSGEGIAKGTMIAPYGYETGFSGSADDSGSSDSANDVGHYEANTTKGTWNVFVGKWFKAPKLVLDSVNVNFSQQCTPDGLPLYAECQLVFETWRLLKAGELDGFFRIGGL